MVGHDETKNSKVVRLVTSNSLTDAHIIKARLQNAGIDCFLTNENFTNLMPNYNGMLGAGIQVFINESDLPEAQSLIHDNHETKLQCFVCGSSNLVVGHGNKKWKHLLAVVFSLLAGIPFGNIKPKYLCGDCGHES